jgi:hypothetical protein
MNYFWVNQGQTFKEEYKGGYLWAPIADPNGKRKWHWENMQKIKQGDVIVSYNSRLGVMGYCVALSDSYPHKKPS